jgi:hypothetical protein
MLVPQYAFGVLSESNSYTMQSKKEYLKVCFDKRVFTVSTHTSLNIVIIFHFNNNPL